MPSQAERRAAMRARLIDTSRLLFARDGYDATSTNALLLAAGASKGALYHHFVSKQALFEVIFEEVSSGVIERALRDPAVTGSDLERLIGGALAWLEEVRRPDVSRILLDDGPRVLGVVRARDLEARSSLGVMIQSLDRAQRSGEIHVPDIELMARLLNAALAEAALLEFQANAVPDRSLIEANLRRLIEGLGR
jgi:AcrR family transcriptional regulator